MVATAFDFSSLPSFLSYGIPGLVLGLIVAALFGAASMKVTDDRLKAIKLVLQYGLAFVCVATIAVIIPLFINPTVVLHVQVDPDQRPNDPQARAIITSDLSPLPNNAGTIIVQQSQGHDFIKVDITRLVNEVAQQRQSVAELNNELNSANTQLAAISQESSKKRKVLMADVADAYVAGSNQGVSGPPARPPLAPAQPATRDTPTPNAAEKNAKNQKGNSSNSPAGASSAEQHP